MTFTKLIPAIYCTGVITYYDIMLLRYKQPPLDYDLSQYTQYDSLEVFDKVATWDFPIFELEDKASNNILSHVRIIS